MRRTVTELRVSLQVHQFGNRRAVNVSVQQTDWQRLKKDRREDSVTLSYTVFHHRTIYSDHFSSTLWVLKGQNWPKLLAKTWYERGDSLPDRWPIFRELNSLQRQKNRLVGKYFNYFSIQNTCFCLFSADYWASNMWHQSVQNIHYRFIKLWMYLLWWIKVPAVVDLPTPPFPEATTMTCLTPVMGFCLGRPFAICCFCLSCNALGSTDLCEK